MVINFIPNNVSGKHIQVISILIASNALLYKYVSIILCEKRKSRHRYKISYVTNAYRADINGKNKKNTYIVVVHLYKTNQCLAQDNNNAFSLLLESKNSSPHNNKSIKSLYTIIFCHHSFTIKKKSDMKTVAHIAYKSFQVDAMAFIRMLIFH